MDRDVVHKLYERLVGDGLDVWLDAKRLHPGQAWRDEIRNALLKCDTVVVCLSRGFDKQRGYRHEELKLALRKAGFMPAGEVFIIPVRLEECDTPEVLRHLHRVDLFKPGGYKRLVDALLNKTRVM
jgi:hypothetical protein